MPQLKGCSDDSEGTVGRPWAEQGHAQVPGAWLEEYRQEALRPGPGGGRAEWETFQRLSPKPWGPVGFGDCTAVMVTPRPQPGPLENGMSPRMSCRLFIRTIFLACPPAAQMTSLAPADGEAGKVQEGSRRVPRWS